MGFSKASDWCGCVGAWCVQWLKTKYIKGYHYFGATAMRPLSKGGVVDSDCKVYGVTGLRVVDVSIMPVKVGPTTLSSRPTRSRHLVWRDILLRPLRSAGRATAL